MMVDATRKDLDQDSAIRLVKSTVNDHAQLINQLGDELENLATRIKSLETDNKLISKDISDLAGHVLILSSHAQLKRGLVPLDTDAIRQILAKRKIL